MRFRCAHRLGASRTPHDFPNGDLVLRSHGQLLGSWHARRTAAIELLDAKAGQHGKLEGTDAVRTPNHCQILSLLVGKGPSSAIPLLRHAQGAWTADVILQ